jgi:hypothetical protein
MLRGGVRRVEWEMGGFPWTICSTMIKSSAELLTPADEEDAQSMLPTQGLHRKVGPMEVKREKSEKGAPAGSHQVSD